MSAGEYQPHYHPAGFDDELRLALEDLRAGRWRETQELLTRTGENWELRTARTQVLAVAAARTDAIAAWLTEEPSCADAVVMEARVAVQRALYAHRTRQPDAERLAARARMVSQDATQFALEDPVPWVCLLSLALVDMGQHLPEHRVPPPEGLLPTGPWGLLEEVYKRDPYNREAWHRMLQVFYARKINAFDYVRWVASWAPLGSPLLVLPLYAYAEDYRSRRASGATSGLALYWISEQVTHYTSRALDDWFRHSAPATLPQPSARGGTPTGEARGRTPISLRSPVDLNHLGHALYAGGFDGGTEVFEAIGPHATPAPWQDIADSPQHWEEEFLRAGRYFLGGGSRR
ncbi:hypothetical protein [Actinacidiphila soli]|uniref:hypothetical protein n=1 Tax=Actinacidiphila soli TaxID=2487275 RepID=UPI000FC9F101|nr:hypothetical protein [Actinacidiphila soli]